MLTLVCAYFGLWEATKTRDIEDVIQHVNADISPGLAELLRPFRDVSATMPLLVGIHESNEWSGPVRIPKTRHYYFWFFGYVAKLPYEREVDPQPSLEEMLYVFRARAYPPNARLGHYP